MMVHERSRRVRDLGHPLLNEYYFECAKGATRANSTTSDDRYCKESSIDQKALAPPPKKRREEPPQAEVTAWGEILGLKKTVSTSVAKFGKLLPKTEDLEVQLAARLRREPENQLLQDLQDKVQHLAGELAPIEKAARDFLHAFPKAARQCQPSMEAFKLEVDTQEEALQKSVNDLEEVFSDIRAALKASKAAPAKKGK